MAKYLAVVNSKQPIETAFDYLSDLTNLEEWDPGVSEAKLVEGSNHGLAGKYAVKANRANLEYEITVLDKPNHLGFQAKTRFFTSVDHIYFKKTETGCEVTYDALLELNGPLSFLDFALKKMFKRIGDKAATGLAEALDGEVTEAKLA